MISNIRSLKPDNKDTLLLHPMTPFEIVNKLSSLMGSSINFNHQTSRVAIEICDVRTNWCLFAEMQPVEFFGFDSEPESALRGCQFSTQPLRLET